MSGGGLEKAQNGNYAFIDSDREPNNVLVEQMQGTLVTIAKDVKLAGRVSNTSPRSRRLSLIGYENRLLADTRFSNDDARGTLFDIGAGPSVTSAVMRIVPVGVGRSARAYRKLIRSQYQGARGSGEFGVGVVKQKLVDAELAKRDADAEAACNLSRRRAGASTLA